MQELQPGCPMGPQCNPLPRCSQLLLPAAPTMPVLAGAGKQQGRDRRGTFLLAGGREDPDSPAMFLFCCCFTPFLPFPLLFGGILLQSDTSAPSQQLVITHWTFEGERGGSGPPEHMEEKVSPSPGSETQTHGTAVPPPGWLSCQHLSWLLAQTSVPQDAAAAFKLIPAVVETICNEGRLLSGLKSASALQQLSISFPRQRHGSNTPCAQCSAGVV